MFELQPASMPQNRWGEMRSSRQLWSWLLILILICGGVYLCDYLLVRYKIAMNRNPFGVVKVRRYYAIPQKSGKTEFAFQEPESQVCVQSLFPHFGYSPCWYAKRKNVKRIDM